MNPTIPNQDYFDACQEYMLGQLKTNPPTKIIRDEKRDDWKKLNPEQKKEFIAEMIDTAKDEKNALAMNVLYQIMMDFEERIQHLEGWR